MKKTSLRKAISFALGVTAMAGVSTQASAFTSTDLGTFTGTTITQLDAAPFKSWTDYNANNWGWVHTADWFKIQIGSNADITAGTTYDVNFDLAERGTTSPMITGGFSIWTSGSTAYVDGFGFHQYNQVMGKNDTTSNAGTSTANNNIGNIIDGHDGWVGYAQNGVTFTNGDGDVVANGGSANMTSGAISGYTADVSSSASLTLNDLAAGYYLIGLGGACPENLFDCNPLATGGVPARDYTLTVSQVPVPAAVWLFGSAIAGLSFTSRRKNTA